MSLERYFYLSFFLPNLLNRYFVLHTARININLLFILHLYCNKDVIIVEETKFAELDLNKLEAIKQLEQKLNVTLIAYDLSPSHSNHHEDAPIVINPS